MVFLDLSNIILDTILIFLGCELNLRICIFMMKILIGEYFVCRYGLLGPSGCGKTTLLNCILGETTLDSGKIYIKAQRHSEISYMPQVLWLIDFL